MTIRRKLHATILSVALAAGAVTISAASVSAAPTVAAPVAVTGGDALAGYADVALSELTSYVVTGSARAREQFNLILDGVAAAAAARLGLDPAAMQAAWRAADVEHQTALMAAFSQLGTRYRAYKATPGVGFDCSGLTSWAWGQAGVSIFHQSRTQINNARAVTRETAQAGDLVYYPGHVMMYLGVDNAIIHAPSTGRTVEVAFVAKRRAQSVRFGDPTS
ncbi:MAG TPA: NlpC/P60 family protein [Ilumatobacteraceae bacterium]|nr:NlpC/P60 family protein [Ilumatobacteraceae bacterium]HRB02994.1 NlpC/P60 family protein [Ilumatobacteraceae bacterium]